MGQIKVPCSLSISNAASTLRRDESMMEKTSSSIVRVKKKEAK
jgi:hypothetical protein